MFKQKIEEISPSLRYCAYNIGDDSVVSLGDLRTGGSEGLEGLIQEAKKQQAVMWERGMVSVGTLSRDWKHKSVRSGFVAANYPLATWLSLAQLTWTCISFKVFRQAV